MNLAVVQRILGLLLMLFSLTMLPPVARLAAVPATATGSRSSTRS